MRCSVLKIFEVNALDSLVENRLCGQYFSLIELIASIFDGPFMGNQQYMSIVVQVLLLHWVSNNNSYQQIQEQVTGFNESGTFMDFLPCSKAINRFFDLQLIEIYFTTALLCYFLPRTLFLQRLQTYQILKVLSNQLFFPNIYNTYITFKMGCALTNNAQLNTQLPANRYQTLEMLGKGTHGMVYRSHDVVQAKDYALKIIEKLPIDISLDSLNELMSSRYMKLNKIHHPNLVHYEAIELKDSKLSILMDLSPFGSLSKKISSEGRLPEAVVSLFSKQILEGLLQIHNNGFLHKDLKPTNVFVFDNQTVKLADYSIADIYDERLREVRSSNPKLNHIQLNNIPYMAPQVVKNLGATTFSDVWSLGCIVVFMLTGKRPWTDLGSREEVFKKVTKSSIPPLPFGITVACEHFLESCLQVIPSQRSKVEDLLDHPFITGVAKYKPQNESSEKKMSVNEVQAVKLAPQQISLRVQKPQKSDKNKCLKTEQSQTNKQYLQYLNDELQNHNADRLLTEQNVTSEKKKTKQGTKSAKKRSNIFVTGKKDSRQDNYIMLNNKKVKFKTSFYKSRRQHVLSTEETEWTSPSRVRVKAVKQLRNKQAQTQANPIKFQPSLGIHSVMSHLHQDELVFQNRLRIETQPCEHEGEDYFKKPLKLLKKKLQLKKEQVIFQEKMSNATRRFSLVQQIDKLRQYKNDCVNENQSNFFPSRLQNYEEIVIDTEVARAQRNRYKEVKQQTQKLREIRRRKWQFQLNRGKELMKTEKPFSFYLQ